MRMSNKLYESLKTDIHIWAGLKGREVKGASLGEMWNLFHFALRDRMNDDNHPAYATGQWTRGVPFWGGEGNEKWLDQFYRVEGLNDDHIATALRKMSK